MIWTVVSYLKIRMHVLIFHNDNNYNVNNSHDNNTADKEQRFVMRSIPFENTLMVQRNKYRYGERK